jgi:hypothetical protein
MHPWRLRFLVVFLAPVLSADVEDFPEFSVGQSDVVFHEAAPESSNSELKRRFHATKTPPAYEIAKERFRVVVPESYRHDALAWGLFVWVDPSPHPNLASDWAHVLAEKKLLFVAAYNTGNSRNLFDRCRLAIDAVHNMKKRFHIDGDRVYVSGLSGGGRVSSMLGVACADVFTGAFPIVGASFYKPIPTGKPNEVWPSLYQPEASILAQAKGRNRYVLLTGEKDFNRENTLGVYNDGFKADGFHHVLYLDVPGLGHERPPSDWLAKGITFLDDRAPSRDDARGRPAERP